MEKFEEPDDGPEFFISFKEDEKYGVGLILAYHGVIKIDDEAVDNDFKEFLMDAVQTLIALVRESEPGEQISLDITGLSIFYHSYCTAVHMMHLPYGKDYVRLILKADKLDSSPKNVQRIIEDIKRIAHHHINDIDKRYGDIPEVAGLRQQAETNWSWLQKN